jgi:D-sedoheptulose 7-phosphate isomerase
MTAADHPHVADLHGQARAQWGDIVSRLADPPLVAAVDAAGEAILAALASGHQLLVAGNGGSAAMASHVAAEFAGKCVMDRKPLPALSLAESSTTVTAVANDYGFDQVFVRGVRAFGRPGDVLLAMSTSGSSTNVVAALEVARDLGLTTILLTGERPVPAGLADHVLQAPSGYTPRIQEVHLLWSHAWCEAVDMAWADLR